MAKKKIKKRILKSTAPKKCYFCNEKKEPDFSDIGTLKKFLTERSKIVPRSRNGLCARHQKHLSAQVKYGRHLAMLPFLVRV
ncbi:30S ribosomal protein S18 [Patescibacteria group bacterium]|nr:30S ribosomal protein S18 [Patescibacteria group bacterium]